MIVALGGVEERELRAPGIRVYARLSGKSKMENRSIHQYVVDAHIPNHFFVASLYHLKSFSRFSSWREEDLEKSNFRVEAVECITLEGL